MRAVILAAGRGRRLGVLSYGKPKCLLEIGGKTILERQLTALQVVGVERFTIVTGFNASMVASQARWIVDGRAEFVYNSRFAATDTAYSLHLALQNGAEAIYYLSGDVIVNPEMLTRLARTGAASAILADRNEFCNQDAKILLSNSRIIRLNHRLPIDMADGRFIGAARFSRRSAKSLQTILDAIIDSQGSRFPKVEDAIDRILDRHFIEAIDISDLPYAQIKTEQDLIRARTTLAPQLRHSDRTYSLVA